MVLGGSWLGWAWVAQSIECWPANQKIGGSILGLGTLVAPLWKVHYLHFLQFTLAVIREPGWTVLDLLCLRPTERGVYLYIKTIRNPGPATLYESRYALGLKRYTHVSIHIDTNDTYRYTCWCVSCIISEHFPNYGMRIGLPLRKL